MDISNNPFLKIPIRNLKRNKLRSFLLLIAVTLTVSLQIGIAISVDSLLNDFIQGQRNHNYTDITIRSKEDLTLESIKDLIPAIKTVDGVGKISMASTFPVESIITLNDTLGRYHVIYGCLQTHPDFPYLQLESGEKSLDPGEVIISFSTAYVLDLELGDELVLDAVPEIGFTGATLTISAIMADDYPFGNFADYGFILIDYDYLKGLFESTDQLRYYITISIPSLLKVNEIALSIGDLEIEEGLELSDRYFVVREKYIDELRATGFVSYQTAMNLLVIASYVIEFLFITNVFAITMKERSREFGTLRAIGTSKRQIISLVLSETGLIGFIGSTVGVIVGLGLSVFLLWTFKYYLNYTGINDLVVQFPTLFLSFFTGLFVTILSGIWPMLVVIRLPIVQNIHSLQEAKLKKRRILTWKSAAIFGVLLIIAGIITSTFVEGSEFLGFNLLSPHSLVIVLIFAGTLALEGAIVSLLPRFGIKLFNRQKLAPLLIATKDVEREIQRSTITIFTAALSLTFILIVGIVSGGLFDAVPEYYRQSFGENTDLVIETWDHYEYNTTFTENLEYHYYWIKETAFMQEERGTLNIGPNVYFFGVNASSYDYFLAEFMLDPQNITFSELLRENIYNVVVTDVLAENLGIKVGDFLKIEITYDQSADIEVGGICSGNPFIHGGEYIFIDYQVFQSLWNKTSAKWFVADIYDNVLPQHQAEEQLDTAFPLLKSIKSTFFYYKMIENSLAVQGAFIHLIFIHSFLLSGLTQFISILISTLKMERDVAVMRSFGLSKGEVFRLFVSEAGLLGFTGVFIGIFNSIIGSELLAWYISLSIPIEATISGLRDQFMFLMWIFISLLVTFGSSYIPSKRASQTNIIAAISGRQERKNIKGLYRPREVNVQAIADKLQAEAIEVLPVSKAMMEDKEMEDLLKEIDHLSEGLDLLIEENKKWNELFNKYLTDYKDGKIDKDVFANRIKRYRKFLMEKKQN